MPSSKSLKAGASVMWEVGKGAIVLLARGSGLVFVALAAGTWVAFQTAIDDKKMRV